MINLSARHRKEWEMGEGSHEILRDISNILCEDNKSLTSIVAEGMEKKRLHKTFRTPDGSVPYEGAMGERLKDDFGVLIEHARAGADLEAGPRWRVAWTC